MKKHYFLIILILITLKSYSQNYYFSNYQVEDGLSINTITTSIQDHRGFLWFGSKDGLNRFDGYNFKIFRHQEGDEKSLGSNVIRTLHEYKNNIWVGTDKGLYQYNEELEQFDLVENTREKPILDITNDRYGNIWFVTSNKVIKFLPANSLSETQKLSTYNIPNSEWIIKDKKGKIWMATKSELFWYSEKDDTFLIKKLPPYYSNNSPFIITNIYSLNESVLLLGTKYHGALKFNIQENTLKTILPESENPLFVRDFTLNQENELWIATESGLYIYNFIQDDFVNIKKRYHDKYALTDNALYCFTTDHEGGIWIGSYFGGINYFSESYTRFKKYFPKVGENSISGNAIREIHEDKFGKLWIGTEDAGLNRFDPKTQKFENIPTKQLSYHNIHGIFPLEEELWVGTFEHGLDVLDIKTAKRIRHYEVDSTSGSLKSNFIVDIFRSSKEKLYILTSRGIYQYNSSLDNFEIINNLPKNHHYTNIQEDEFGVLWVGTYWDGLYYFNPETGKTGVYRHEESNKNSLSSNMINGIYHDSKNNLWITTENGLNLFDRKGNNFKRITTHDGLPSNITYSVLEDDYNQLWISTSGGLVNLDPLTMETETYTIATGLLSDQFNDNSALKTKEGNMYFGSVKGMISFNPGDLKKNLNTTAPTLFTEMQINNKVVEVGAENSPLPKSLNFLDKIVLKHSQSSFSLDFSTLNYISPEMTRYWYRMEGISDKWIPLGKQHKVFFTELPPGNYQLKVKSQNSQGIWNEESPQLSIEILPPFWLSNWAYLIYFFIIFSLLFFLIRYYHTYTKRKNQQRIQTLQRRMEKEIYQAKIEFFTNVAHEIRTPLTLIKAPLEKITKRANTPPDIKESIKIMKKNTTRLLDLVNQLLDFRKTESKNLKLSFVKVDITKLLKNIHKRFLPIIQEKNINVEVFHQDQKVIAFVDEEAVRKIISNLFSNAVKYSKKYVWIHLSINNEKLELKIANDGNIIPLSQSKTIFEPFFRIKESETTKSGTGIGLSLAHSLAVLHHGNLELKNEDEEKNTFILSLPLHQEKEFQLYDLENKNPNTELKLNLRKNIHSSEKPKIILVEDNEDLLDFLYKELEQDYFVFKTQNAQTALDIINKENIQLVLSDVSMPGMSGYELSNIIKNNLESSHIPVILLTAKNEIEARVEGLQSGADTYMTKPFSIDHLKAQINSLIQSRISMTDYFSSTPLAHIKSIAHTKTDSDFLKKLDEVIYENMSNPDLRVEILSEVLNMSRSTLYRKINELTDLTPNELVNMARLKKAAHYLKTSDLKIYEIAEKVGYKSQTSFGRNFQKQFKMTPSEYIQKNYDVC